ncbi:serine hydrolase domain-containing protein [Alkalicoccus daliensis]|uniref:CubicO group peptidase, beta-lactamase class C family n=1 Tax=Alkalicoccus daliensis TaxID=745820 RepID=A0A1H0AKF1_9BACI|nr:serine hydrolase [Alkalicoccus daliensis]SDN34028.1 CubicO group peptidase, beta-lactamase class C family [Alkalicoccus daliensis]
MDEQKLLEKMNFHQMYACVINKEGNRTFSYFHDGNRNSLQVLNSVSKSVLALAIGIAVDDELITLDTKVGKVLTDVHPHMKNRTIRDLLMMQSGYSEKQWNLIIKNQEWAQKAAETMPGTLKPRYSNADSYLLSLILSKVISTDWLDYFYQRLFRPLGIEEFIWEKSPERIPVGGYGLQMKAEDLLKLGELVLNQGGYMDKQIIGSEFISEMTSPLIKGLIRNQHYGLHWWSTPDDSVINYAAGTNGKFLFVQPDKKITAVFIGHLPGKDLLPFRWFTKLVLEN